MPHNKLEDIYKQIFNYIYPDIEYQREGVLYTVLGKILYEQQEHLGYVYKNLNIKPNAKLNQDKEIVDGLISNPDNHLLNQLNPLKNNEKMELYWIVVIACILSGASFSLKYYFKHIHQQNTKQAKGGNEKNPPTVASPSQAIYPPQQKPLTAALCLVVRASAVNNLRKDNSLDASDIEKLIDNAAYFLCTTTKDADSKQQSIETTDEVIPSDSTREIYIRIHIADGQEMIGKKATYYLKRNLPSDGQGVVEQLACLRNLSGLETFNRI